MGFFNREMYQISRKFTREKVNQKPTSSRTLRDLSQYFGTEYAFYFGWIAYYTEWLIVPAVAGIVLHLYNRIYIGDGELDHYTVLYSVGEYIIGNFYENSVKFIYLLLSQISEVIAQSETCQHDTSR